MENRRTSTRGKFGIGGMWIGEWVRRNGNLTINWTVTALVCWQTVTELNYTDVSGVKIRSETETHSNIERKRRDGDDAVALWDSWAVYAYET